MSEGRAFFGSADFSIAIPGTKIKGVSLLHFLSLSGNSGPGKEEGASKWLPSSALSQAVSLAALWAGAMTEQAGLVSSLSRS